MAFFRFLGNNFIFYYAFRVGDEGPPGTPGPRGARKKGCGCLSPHIQFCFSSVSTNGHNYPRVKSLDIVVIEKLAQAHLASSVAEA